MMTAGSFPSSDLWCRRSKALEEHFFLLRDVLAVSLLKSRGCRASDILAEKF